jgi:hypothetical protein
MAKRLFDIDESTLSEMSRDKYRIYKEIFGSLEGDRLLAMNQMCSIFEIANVAYRAIAAIGKYHTEVSGVCEAGCAAQQVMVHFEILKDALKCDEQETIKKIDDTSKYLKGKGWYGLPEPLDAEGCKHIKTADGLVSDMRRYAQAFSNLQKQAEEAKKLAGGK